MKTSYQICGVNNKIKYSRALVEHVHYYLDLFLPIPKGTMDGEIPPSVSVVGHSLALSRLHLYSVVCPFLYILCVGPGSDPGVHCTDSQPAGD